MVFLILFQIGMERGPGITFNSFFVIYVIAGFFGIAMMAYGTELRDDIGIGTFYKPVAILTVVSIVLMLISYFAKDWLSS